MSKGCPGDFLNWFSNCCRVDSTPVPITGPNSCVKHSYKNPYNMDLIIKWPATTPE